MLCRSSVAGECDGWDLLCVHHLLCTASFLECLSKNTNHGRCASAGGRRTWAHAGQATDAVKAGLPKGLQEQLREWQGGNCRCYKRERA